MISIEEYAKLRKQKLSEEDAQKMLEDLSPIASKRAFLWLTRHKYNEEEAKYEADYCNYEFLFQNVFYVSAMGDKTRINFYKFIAEKLGIEDQLSEILKTYDKHKIPCMRQAKNLLRETLEVLNNQLILNRNQISSVNL